jgi:hypothetical protein
MGTNGIYGFRKFGQDKITYHHFSSYPKGLGAKIVDFCRVMSIDELNKIYDNIGCYFLYHIENNKKGLIGDNSNSIRVSEVPKDLMPTATFFYNEQAYSTHCRDYRDYQTWLNERNMQRYVDVGNHGQQIDGKNLLHCRRLLDVAMEIAETGELNVRRANSDYLLSIRQGKVPLEDIIKQAEEDILKLDELYANSDLPEKVDMEFLNDLLLQIRKM